MWHLTKLGCAVEKSLIVALLKWYYERYPLSLTFEGYVPVPRAPDYDRENSTLHSNCAVRVRKCVKLTNMNSGPLSVKTVVSEGQGVVAREVAE